jgi:uncharacterized protein YecT (DUF1311 family)
MIVASVSLFSFAAHAQDQPDVDCNTAITQMEMTYCAQLEFGEADELLNAQYKSTRDVMRKWDADSIDELNGAEDALVTAQRAWVTFRDAHCASVGYQAHGGTMEPMLIYGCQAELTRARTDELKQLADSMVN